MIKKLVDLIEIIYKVLSSHGVNIYVIETDDLHPKDADEAIMGLLGNLFNEKKVHEMLNKIENDDLVSVNDIDFSGKELMDYVDLTMAAVNDTRCDRCHEPMNEKDGLEAMGKDMELVCEPCSEKMQQCPKCDKFGEDEAFSFGQEECDNCIEKAADMEHDRMSEATAAKSTNMKALKDAGIAIHEKYKGEYKVDSIDGVLTKNGNS